MRIPTEPPSPTSGVAHSVLQQLMALVVEGTYGPGYRLPSERDLCQQLGASRGSVRQALQRLQHMGVVAIRKGSGATVQHVRFWSAGVVEPVIQHHLARARWEVLAPMVQDAFEVRRHLMLGVFERAAGRLQPGQLDGARAEVRQTWELRDDLYQFALSDRLMGNRVLQSAGLLVSMWTLNALNEPYLELVSLMASLTTFEVPDSYVAAHHEVFDALEQGDGPAARDRLQTYLDDLDQKVMQTLPLDLLPSGGAGDG